MADVTMPRLSDTMEEGTIASWLKKPGEKVDRGEVIAQIETDKATMDLTAFEAGTLQEILAPEGTTVAIGQPLHGRNLAPVDLDRQVGAGAHRRPVDEDGAGSTHLGIARALGALEPQAVTQDVEQQRVGGDVERHRLPVDAERDAEAPHVVTLSPAELKTLSPAEGERAE